MPTIARRMAKGVAWMVLFKLLERSIGLISTIALARLLVPEDFGLIAMAMSIVGMLELLYSFSFDMALIQNQEAGPEHYNTAWTFNFVFGVFSGILLILLAPFAAGFYDEARLESIIYLLAVGMFITALENIGIVDFRKHMQFDREFKFGIARRLVSFAVTLSIAFAFRTYWALVCGILAGKVTSTVLSYTMHPFRPWFSLRRTSELFGFSSWLLVNNLLYFLKLRSADFVIGRSVGSAGLGLFSISYEISNMPTTELVAPINRAVFPGYASMTREEGLLERGFVGVLSVIFLFVLPIGAGISVMAEPLVEVFLGAKWHDAVPLIQILAFFGVATALQANIGTVFLAVGKPRIQTALAFAYVAALLPALIYVVPNWGVEGAAWVYFSVSVGILPITYYLVVRELRLSWRTVGSVAWRPMVSVAVMYAVVVAYLQWFDAAGGLDARLIGMLTGAALGALVYVVCDLVLWLGAGRPAGSESVVIGRLAEMPLPILNSVARRLAT